jgi:hypothetical protein
MGRSGEHVSERPDGGPRARRSSRGVRPMRVALAHRRSHGGGGAGLPARRTEEPHDDKGVVDRMAGGGD